MSEIPLCTGIQPLYNITGNSQLISFISALLIAFPTKTEKENSKRIGRFDVCSYLRKTVPCNPATTLYLFIAEHLRYVFLFDRYAPLPPR